MIKKTLTLCGLIFILMLLVQTTTQIRLFPPRVIAQDWVYDIYDYGDGHIGMKKDHCALCSCPPNPITGRCCCGLMDPIDPGPLPTTPLDNTLANTGNSNASGNSSGSSSGIPGGSDVTFWYIPNWDWGSVNQPYDPSTSYGGGSDPLPNDGTGGGGAFTVNPPADPTTDCAGVSGGAAFTDCTCTPCKCVGGTSGNIPCSIPKKPCSASAVANSSAVNTMFSNAAWAQRLNDLKNTVTNITNVNEAISVLNYMNGAYTRNDICLSCTPSSASYNYNSSTVATAHIHPKSSYPSPRDLFTILEIYDYNSKISDSYMLCADGAIYAFHIEDPSLVRSFFSSFPALEQNGMFVNGSTMKKDFDKARDDLGNQQKYNGNGSRPDMGGSLAWAYILEKYNSGVKILKQDIDGSFKELRVKMERVQGKDIYKPSQCN